eukprot:GGOE01003917.1.p1 GENE.GGOE01003917.1~~GGOE01003917.1.p1  ORF type:complete len:276 (+),score=74.96 GGOE01003917.1:39-830(+)
MTDTSDALCPLLGTVHPNHSRPSGPPLTWAFLLKLLLALWLAVAGPLLCSRWVDAMDLLYALETAVDIGAVADVLAFCCLVLWAVCLLPTSVFEMAVGYSFGFQRAVFITWAGKTTGGIVAFVLGRTLLRDSTSALMQSHPLARALKAEMTDKMLMLVFLVRVAYIPMAVKNYGLSVCPGVSLLTFSAVSSLVNVPYSVVWSWWGSELQMEQDGSPTALSVMHTATLIVALCASAFLVVLSFRWTSQLYARMELEVPDCECGG